MFFLFREFEKRQDALQDLVHTLDARVAQQTRDLTIVIEISAKISTILDLQNLLSQVTEIVRDAFDLYHYSIFLFNPETETLTLSASAGRNNLRLESNQFHLSDKGIVP